MKNTMKKIMGLLLVAVLLASVVPFQALAAEVVQGGNNYKGFDSIDVYEAGVGTLLASKAWANGKDPETKTVADLLNYAYPGWSSDFTLQSAEYQGAGYTDLSTVFHTNFASTGVKIYLNRISSYESKVYFYKEGTNTQIGSTAVFTRKAGQTLSWNDITAQNPEPTAYKVSRINSVDGTIAIKNGGSATITGATDFIAYLEGINTPNTPSDGGNSGSTGNTGVLTAIYHINNTTNTQYYDVDGKTVRELVSMGGYNVSDYNVTPSNLDTIYNRGQSVDIYLSPKTTTPTNPTTPSSNRLNANFYVNSTSTISKSFPFDFDTKYVDQLISEAGYNIDNYNYSAKVDGSSINVDSYIVRRGQTVNIYLTSKSNNNSTSNKFPAKVYLHVYLNNNIGEPDRNLNITNTLAADGKVHMNEVKNLLPTYYKAKNSNGIKYDGLYATNGNEWVKDYVDDNKAEFLDEIDVRQGYEYVHINVMITNATAKSSNADTTNPKTGDAIFMTITVMGLSAAALTGLYFYDKKRKAL